MAIFSKNGQKWPFCGVLPLKGGFCPFLGLLRRGFTSTPPGPSPGAREPWEPQRGVPETSRIPDPGIGVPGLRQEGLPLGEGSPGGVPEVPGPGPRGPGHPGEGGFTSTPRAGPPRFPEGGLASQGRPGPGELPNRGEGKEFPFLAGSGLLDPDGPAAANRYLLKHS